MGEGERTVGCDAATKPRNRRPKNMKRFVVDFCRVIDCKEFDLEELQKTFRNMKVAVGTSEIIVQTKLSKTQVMLLLDKALAKSMCLLRWTTTSSASRSRWRPAPRSPVP